MSTRKRSARWRKLMQVVTIADRPGNEQALEALRSSALDMQTAEFWRAAWFGGLPRLIAIS